MPTLTIEAIRENPWNVVTHKLPTVADELLLELASLAAAYCRASEYLLMHAAREGRYVPPGWEPRYPFPDGHEANEARGECAGRKLEEIGDVYEKVCGVILDR
jgi:hypothetical protein